MFKILFTDSQLKKINENKWVRNVSNRAITYEDEFKIKLINETADYSKTPRQVFIECGLNPDMIGDRRIDNSAYRWKKQYQTTGETGVYQYDSKEETIQRYLEKKEAEPEKTNNLFLIISSVLPTTFFVSTALLILQIKQIKEKVKIAEKIVAKKDLHK